EAGVKNTSGDAAQRTARAAKLDVSMTPPPESMVPTFGGATPSRRASGALDVSQAEPLPFFDSPPPKGGAPARLGIRFTIFSLIAIGIGVFVAWEMRTFGFESYLFHSLARDAAFQ